MPISTGGFDDLRFFVCGGVPGDKDETLRRLVLKLPVPATERAADAIDQLHSALVAGEEAQILQCIDTLERICAPTLN